MEVPAGHDGIQQLLLAEQEAQAIIAKARKGEKTTITIDILVGAHGSRVFTMHRDRI